MKQLISMLGFGKKIQKPLELKIKEESTIEPKIRISKTVYPDDKPRMSAFSNTPWYGL